MKTISLVLLYGGVALVTISILELLTGTIAPLGFKVATLAITTYLGYEEKNIS